MTVIAWDGSTLAADKRAGTGAPRTVTKIRRAPNGNLIGASGTVQGDAELMAWYERGADPEQFPQSQRVDATASQLVVVDRETRRVLHFCTTPYPAVFEDQHFACGSGRDFALMAMRLGYDARGAVELTCELCAECGNGIDMLTLED
jgi:ATP-dependent protease HslVU (ClpYQ) peptidase subunit